MCIRDRVIDYTYTPEGLPATMVQTPAVDSLGSVRTTTYQYTPAGLLAELVSPDNITYTYSYDERSRLVKVTDNVNQSYTLSYDEYGNVVETEQSNADNSSARMATMSYDSRHRNTEVKLPHIGVSNSVWKWVYDAEDNTNTSMDANLNSSGYSYDAVDRLSLIHI